MTRNQKMAIEILKMLDSGICAEVGYYTCDDSVVFCNYKKGKIIDIFFFMDNAEAQRRFDVIKSTIEEMKADVD